MFKMFLGASPLLVAAVCWGSMLRAADLNIFIKQTLKDTGNVLVYLLRDCSVREEDSI